MMAATANGSRAAMLAVLMVLAVLVASASAGIIAFKGKQLKPVSTIRYRMAMMEDKENPPFITFDHKWTVEDSKTCSGAQTLHILLYPAKQAGSIGNLTAGDESRQYCCTDPRAPECRDGIWISSTRHVKHFTSVTNPATHNGYVNHTVQVSTTSQYIAEYVQCTSDCAFAIDGSLTFKNSYGYLSAELRHYVVLFGILSGLYLVLFLYWAGLSCWHRRVLLMVQYWIALVIFLGLVESISWFLEFLIANVDGKRNWPAIETAILVSTSKRTLSRVLVLIVSMGYGVVKYHLGNTRVKVYLMGVAYFVASGIQSSVEIMSREGETNDFLSFVGTVVIFPVILLDTLFYWWIFLSLMKTIQQLTARQASVKLTLYKQFFTVLVCAAVFTACVMIVELAQVALLPRASLWMSEWMITTCWHALYFAVLTAIAILWRPTENNTRYAYTESEDAEIMLEEVHPIEGITQRKTKEESTEEAVANSINTDGVDVELTLPSFTIDEDDDFLDEAAKMQ